GEHVEVLDAKGSPVASPDLAYEYYPFEQRDSFDQVNAYYHLERAHARFARRLKVHDLPWFDGSGAVRARVNVVQLCDSFYSHDLDGDGVPGFAFGDQSTCDFTNEDFAADSDVIYHEYTH